MAREYYKLGENEANVEFYDYFYLNNLKNYEVIYIINDKNYDKVIKNLNLDNITIFSNEYSVTDNNPIYLNLKILNNSKIIYLKEKLDLFNDDCIKTYISSFNGIIICNINLLYYLKKLNLISKDYILKENTYLKIDKYGLSKDIEIKDN